MAVGSFAIKYDSFNTNISNGFSHLQQREEFVDMTLAAAGYQVKVHQNIIALASPYLKSLLQSIPCKNPIIFLNKVTPETLGYILEYIYTGEVIIPTDEIQTFLDVTSELHITTLKNFTMPELNSDESQDMGKNPSEIQIHDSDGSSPETLTRRKKRHRKKLLNSDKCIHFKVNERVQSNIENCISNPNSSLNECEEENVSGHNLIEIIETVPSQNNVEGMNHSSSDKVIAQKILNILTPTSTSNGGVNLDSNSKQDPSLLLEPLIPIDSNLNMQMSDSTSQPLEENNDAEPPINVIRRDEVATCITIKNVESGKYQLEVSHGKNHDWSENINTETQEATNLASQLTNEMESNDADKAISSTPRYTLSNRGSLQLILNGFMYCSHHQSNMGRNRRWRCVEYRRKHCPVFIDTRGEIIIARKFAHTHSNHEDRILKKMQRDVLFDSIESSYYFSNVRNRGRPREVASS